MATPISSRGFSEFMARMDALCAPRALAPVAPPAAATSEGGGQELARLEVEILKPEPEPEPEVPAEIVLLKQKQRDVLQLLMRGVNVKDAAKLADVNRSTVHRWMKSDPAFGEALKAWHEGMRASARAQMSSAVENSMAVVVEKMHAGNLTAAITILRANGLLNSAKAQAPLIPQDVTPTPEAPSQKGVK